MSVRTTSGSRDAMAAIASRTDVATATCAPARAQYGRHELARIRVVVDGEHVEMLQDVGQGLGRLRGIAGVGGALAADLDADERQPYRERRAERLAGALGGHRAAVQLGEMAHERQPEAEPRMLARDV